MFLVMWYHTVLRYFGSWCLLVDISKIQLVSVINGIIMLHSDWLSYY